MPPPPAPTSNQEPYDSVVDLDHDGYRATKRQRVDEKGNARARAIGPGPEGFTPFPSKTEGTPNGGKKKRPASSSSDQLHNTAMSLSPTKKNKKKKKTTGEESMLGLGHQEQEAAKVLVSIIRTQGSPKSPAKRGSVVSRASSIAGTEMSKAKELKRTENSISSVDVALADTALSTTGVDSMVGDGKSSGGGTVPASPAHTTSQLEEDAAKTMLALSTSPAPLAKKTTRRTPTGPQHPGRVIDFNKDSNASSKSTALPKGLSDSQLFIPAASSNAPPKPLRSPPPSPSKKLAQPTEDRLLAPSGSSGSSVLKAPFTPGGPNYFPATSGGFGPVAFGPGFPGGQPSTPAGFNFADYVNFTPTPGPGASPVSRSGKTGGAPTPMPVPMPANAALMQSIMGGAPYAGAYPPHPHGAFGSPGMGMFGAMPIPPPKKEGEKKKKKQPQAKDAGDGKSAKADSDSKTPQPGTAGSASTSTAPSRGSTASVGPPPTATSRPTSAASGSAENEAKKDESSRA